MNPQALNNWHTAISRFAQTAEQWPRFMYEAKTMAHELPRLQRLHKQEREGTLPQFHQQWAHSAPGHLEENFLTCCLGIRCDTCPALKALENGLQGEDLDKAKAMTCVAHILMSGGDIANEGYVLDQGDMTFWQTLHAGLASYYQEEE